MIHVIDSHRLNRLHATPLNYASPADLRREGRVFFIGADLPVYSTLETMYESYCLESTELFHVTFGDGAAFGQNLEMVRQIKRNFSIRLMGQISYPLSASQVEQVYLAGLDVLDLPHQAYTSNSGDDHDGAGRREAFSVAVATFSRWSVVSTVVVERTAPQEARTVIHDLLGHGVIPLLVLAGEREGDVWNQSESGDLFSFLAAEWHRHRVPLKPIMPLLRLTTPFVLTESSGFLRDVIDKLQDRRMMATSDIRRHLRTSGAEASFESAGL